MVTMENVEMYREVGVQLVRSFCAAQVVNNCEATWSTNHGGFWFTLVLLSYYKHFLMPLKPITNVLKCKC